jgi:hypothetical protein
MDIVKFVATREYEWVYDDLIETHTEFHHYPYKTIDAIVGYRSEGIHRPIKDILRISADAIEELLPSHPDLTWELFVEYFDLFDKKPIREIMQNPAIPAINFMDVMTTDWERVMKQMDYGKTVYMWGIEITDEVFENMVSFKDNMETAYLFDAIFTRGSTDEILKLLMNNEDYLCNDLYQCIMDDSSDISLNVELDPFAFESRLKHICRELDRPYQFEFNYFNLSHNKHITLAYVLANLDKGWNFDVIALRFGRLDTVMSSRYFMELLKTHPLYHKIKWDGRMENEDMYIYGLSNPLLSLEFVANHLYKITDYSRFAMSYNAASRSYLFEPHGEKIVELVNSQHHIIVKYPFGLKLIFRYGNIDVVETYKHMLNVEYAREYLYFNQIHWVHRVKYMMPFIDGSWHLDALAEILPIHIIEKDLNKYNMKHVSMNPSITIEFIRRHRDTIDYDMLEKNEGLTFEMVDEFHDKLDISTLSYHHFADEKKSQIARFIASTL